MKIPKEFEVMGNTVKVNYDDSLLQSDMFLGKYIARNNEIKILPNGSSFKRTKEQIYQTYLHEMVHCILDKMGKHELCDDEEFVDMFANLLLQVEKTKKGEIK